ncbi:helix-turn-helix transcriptional regulator [Orrella dioscoreae]
MIPGRVACNEKRTFGSVFLCVADSAQAALMSALSDVRRAIPTARLIEAAPDFVGLTDVADVVGVSRQNMRKLMLGHAAAFPAPLHEGSTSLWHLADVLSWLEARGAYRIEPPVLEVARTAMQINLAKASHQLRADFKKALRPLLA